MYDKCDPYGNQYLMLDSIVYLRYSTTDLCYANQNFVNNGLTYRRRYQSGWQLQRQRKNVSMSCQKLADLKESHPIETSEYAISDPAFNWRVPYFIKKQERIIFLVKKQSARYLKKTHKFGIRIIKSGDEAYNIDTHNVNVLWTNVISKKMNDFKVAFKSI